MLGKPPSRVAQALVEPVDFGGQFAAAMAREAVVAAALILLRTGPARGLFDKLAIEKALQHRVESSGADLDLGHQGVAVAVSGGESEQHLELGRCEWHDSIEDQYIDNR